MARVLINIPRQARAGEVITLRTLIQHTMETGYRPDAGGVVVPRDILRRFTCAFEGEVVIEADFSPAVAANPYLSFNMVAVRSGEISLRWEGDEDFNQTETRRLEVT